MPKYLRPEQYGNRLDDPLSESTIRRYCREGRIPGAKKYGQTWLVPADAKIKPRGRPQRFVKLEGQSVQEFADKCKVSTVRIYNLLKVGRIPGAKKTAYGWRIPSDAEYPSEGW